MQRSLARFPSCRVTLNVAFQNDITLDDAKQGYVLSRNYLEILQICDFALGLIDIYVCVREALFCS